ncbi:MAG TPA: response regulator transcription factor [Pelobium sp.]
MKIKALIIDDEPFAIDVIANYLTNFEEIEVVSRCSNAVQAFTFLQKTHVDLIFLDINMPGLTGIEFLKSMKNPPKVIFTTAHQDYALEAFDLNAVDYLLKPIPFDRFLKAIEKVFELFKLNVNAKPALAYQAPQLPSETVLYLRVDRKMVKLRVDDIYWLESAKDYIKIALKDKVLVSKQKISVLQQLLPEEKFLRIHRSFMVAIDKIDSYNAYSIEILGKELPIGRNYKLESQRQLRVLS